MSTEYFHTKSYVEETFQERLQDLIATRLPRENFSVNVDFQMRKMSKEKRKPANDELEMLKSFGVGILNVDSIIDSYQQEVERLKEKASQFDKIPKYSVTRARVNVGLSKAYEEAYLKQFETWLKKHLNTSLRGRVTTNVHFIEPKTKPIEEPKKEDVKSLYDKAADFQPLLIMITLGLFALLILLLWKLLQKKDHQGKEMKKASPAPQPMQKEASKEESKEDTSKNDENEDELEEDLDEAITKLRSKIVFIASEVGSTNTLLLKKWQKMGEEGLIKINLLHDALITYSLDHDQASNGNKYSEFIRKINITSDLFEQPAQYLNDSQEIMAELDKNSQIDYMEEIYWELMSLRLVGESHLKEPFSKVNDLKPSAILNVINKLDQKLASTLLLYLNDRNQKEVLKQLDKESLQVHIEQSLEESELTQKEINTIEEQIDKQLDSLADTSESKVSTLPKIIKTISFLPTTQQIHLLKDLKTNKPSQITGIKTNLASLAFIEDFKPEIKTEICQSSTTDEILALLSEMPEQKENVLSMLSEKVRKIVSDDLDFIGDKSEAYIEENLSLLSKRLNDYLKQNQIQAKDLYQDQEDKDIKDAA